MTLIDIDPPRWTEQEAEATSESRAQAFDELLTRHLSGDQTPMTMAEAERILPYSALWDQKKSWARCAIVQEERACKAERERDVALTDNAELMRTNVKLCARGCELKAALAPFAAAHAWAEREDRPAMTVHRDVLAKAALAMGRDV